MSSPLVVTTDKKLTAHHLHQIMDKDRSIKFSISSSSSSRSKHSKKSSKKSKKRHRSRDSETEESKRPISSLVEYSDVSSEDFSAPEAGEINTEESVSLSDADREPKDPAAIAKRATTTAPTKTAAVEDELDEEQRNAQLEMERSIAKMSPGQVRRMIIGSPINSSSNSSIQKSATRSPKRLDDVAQPAAEPLSSSESLDDDDMSGRKRKKLKKDKKHKKKNKTKKRKKRRQKSVSSIETISDNDSVLDETNFTPPITKQNSPAEWDRTYTPLKETSPVSIGTPPLRPGSNASIYSDATVAHPPSTLQPRNRTPTSSTHHRTPPSRPIIPSSGGNSSTKKQSHGNYIASPHTPPLAVSHQKSKSSSNYQSPANNDDMIVDRHHHHMSSSSSSGHAHHHHSHHHYHHHHSSHNSGSEQSSRRITVSPGK